ncbi:hypothetical protein Taro_008057 [Colocasia esculenta]|uniref:Uncharacterized protein n=1 Tax=Colocasia esculenta TaxID=4460 RepID=A0A843U1D6_COLES|nr:hypothetical protein [Colocasia esculenta]
MAAASRDKIGVFVLLFVIFLLRHRRAGADEGDGAFLAAGNSHDAILARREAQLLRLESLVDSLSSAVTRLESALSMWPAPPASGADSALYAPPAVATAENSGAEAASLAAVQQSPVILTKFKLPWSDRFQFVAAARLESDPTCAAALPYADHDGLTKYFAVGDARGAALIFSSGGDVLVEIPAPPSGAPVTAMVAYVSIRRNESLLLTGHGDGSVVAHRLWESAATNDDWPTLVLGGSRPFLQEGDQAAPAIIGLEAHQIGRFKYVIASDGGGRIRVFRENGTLYGTAVASGRPLAFSKQRLLFLTETGAGSLDLHAMAVRETPCEGLDGDQAESYAFDVSERSKAYGFTAGGHLVHLQLLGDAVNLKCRIRAMRQTEIEGPVAVHAFKGYLLAVNREKVFVYNVSSQYYGRVGPPRPLFSATLEEIRSLFSSNGNGNGVVKDGIVPPGKPLIAGDREKLLILGIGGRHIGIYRSNFPVYRAASSTVLWSSPALLFLLFLILVWYFYVKKKDVLGWTSYEAFDASADSSASMLAAPGGDRDRAFADGSRAGDHRDIRGGALRGPPRRYISPPRYAGGAAAAFRPVTSDSSFMGTGAGGAAAAFRPGTSDSSFMGTGDLKYRGQGMEPPGFPKRREAIFANSQVVDDHVE